MMNKTRQKKYANSCSTTRNLFFCHQIIIDRILPTQYLWQTHPWPNLIPPTDNFPVTSHWQSKSDTLATGGEYQLALADVGVSQ